MKNLAVLKSAKNYQNKILWEALYLNGVKQIENYFLDEHALFNAFNIENYTLIKLPIFENRTDTISRLFPDTEDFSYLIENLERIKPGQKVYIDEYIDDQFVIEAGWVTVKDIYNKPNTNLIWEKELFIDSNDQIWFTCLQLPGIFLWNRLRHLQKDLENLYKNKEALIKER